MKEKLLQNPTFKGIKHKNKAQYLTKLAYGRFSVGITLKLNPFL